MPRPTQLLCSGQEAQHGWLVDLASLGRCGLFGSRLGLGGIRRLGTKKPRAVAGLIAWDRMGLTLPRIIQQLGF